jgi:hypothetical protein
MEIVIGSWFDSTCTETVDLSAASIFERMRWEDRMDLEVIHDFRIRHVQMGDWGTVRDMLPLELAAGNRDVHVWIMEAAWFNTLVRDNAFAPLKPEHFTDAFGINWNAGVAEVATIEGTQYAWSAGVDFGGGIYFNMRLFEEAGLPRAYPRPYRRRHQRYLGINDFPPGLP